MPSTRNGAPCPALDRKHHLGETETPMAKETQPNSAEHVRGANRMAPPLPELIKAFQSRMPDPPSLADMPPEALSAHMSIFSGHDVERAACWTI